MSKETKKPAEEPAPKKKNNLILVAAAVLAVCAAVFCFMSGKNQGASQGGSTGETEDQLSGTSQTSEPANTDQGGEETAADASDAFLEIPVADITTDASFFEVEVDGTKMEVIAVRDSGGEIRTAFNICQVCYGSGRGYYEQVGNYLVCQNCGSRFSMDQVEIECGGCNPWPITEENKTVTDDTIYISYQFLAECKAIFANWKTDY